MAFSLGRYQVVKHLASGGMADVLLGRSDGIEGFERHVVLKRIRAEHARDKRFISMFIDEARLAAGLHHQHIVQVFDIGEADGEYFFAMEYIHGEDLRKLLSATLKARSFVPLGLVCSIVSAAASGLHYAHERRDNKGKALNIVHRDVSPSNILIGYDGAVKVVDFGIAKATLRQAETVVGGLKGKCSYMSPEQCKGERIDRRSDVYGLGVLLYELATTSRLFKGDNEYLVMDAIVNGKLTLPQVRRPDLPNELSQIIMRALSVEPERRFQSADELRVALDHFVTNYELNGSTSAVASYMKKIFGERPEPWLEQDIEAEISVQARPSWSNISSADEPGTLVGNDPAAIAESRRSSRRLPMPAPVAAAGTAQSISPYETRPSMKLGWESASPPPARSNKLLWMSVPVLALAAFGLWKFGLDKQSSPPTAAAPTNAAAMPAPAPAPAPTPAPVVEPAPVVPDVRVAGAAPADAAVESTPVPAEVTVERQVKKNVATKPVKKATPETPASTAKVAVAAAPAPAPAPTPAPAPARIVMPAPAPTPPPAAVPAPAPTPAPTPAITAPAPAPKEIEAQQLATLSNATVSAIASDHSRQLSSCEGGASLKGDVAVTFQIDGNGKVIKSQLSSTIKNPKVAGCILKAVQSWKFPRPPSGAAKGVYTISYQ
jgi:serine/threonine-protein kinase